ncbi:NAD(P)-binding protein [Iocasia frigidifontis]|uniref:NAD(P)-binding protein n=1 Tax=Iocasia fonsfrigidae TaxID=2682810 RepID=A0A8A7KFT0_9FIRM|nr:FAD-dependent oxidoreductase [Iocasia fonsfrigidae]QTL96722.1 NAD(P)-binding protein [Iocasia fonsfrigidae]
MNKVNNINIEVYSKKWCPYCRKAKAFLKSKGFSFFEYDVGEEGRLAEMEERTGKKSVPQILIDDYHVGGYNDLIEMENSGRLNELLGIKGNDYSQRLWELIIVGAGPAGLNAALYAARKGIEVLLLTEDLGGQVIDTNGIDNYIGKRETNGSQLINDFWEHIQQYDIATIVGEKANEIKAMQGEHRVISNNNREYKARTIIIASGAQKRHLGMKQEYVLTGRGVHYCAVCDGYLYAGRPVAVVGGGNSGLEASLDLAKMDCDVSLIEIQNELMGDQYLQEQIEKNDNIRVYKGTQVKKIKGEEKLESVVIKDNKTAEEKELSIDALFIEIGLVANSDFLNGMVGTNERKEIIINENNETDVEGIWAAGDVTNIKDKQIIIAAAEGAKAALRVNEYLK